MTILVYVISIENLYLNIYIYIFVTLTLQFGTFKKYIIYLLLNTLQLGLQSSTLHVKMLLNTSK